MSALLATAQQFGAGNPVLVADADTGTGLIAAAASRIAPQQLARLQALGHGAVVLGMSEDVAERLRLPAPASPAQHGEQLRLMAPIDAVCSSEGGWSLHDRALTMRTAADPQSRPGALRVPGHVLAGQIPSGSPGGAAAALELARLAELEPVVALLPMLDDAGRVAPLAALIEQPRISLLPYASSTELHGYAAWRRASDLAVSCDLPLRDGRFTAIGFGEEQGEEVTIAFVHGDPASVPDPFVHVHVACRLGDVFGSLLCECRAELDAAISHIVAIGCGVIVYAPAPTAGLMECPRGRGGGQPGVSGLLRAIGVDFRPHHPQPTPALAQRPRLGAMENSA